MRKPFRHLQSGGDIFCRKQQTSGGIFTKLTFIASKMIAHGNHFCKKRFPKAAALGGGGAQHRPIPPPLWGGGRGWGDFYVKLTIQAHKIDFPDDCFPGVDKSRQKCYNNNVSIKADIS